MRKTGQGYYICTNAVDVFHFTYLDTTRGFETGQPYMVFGATKEVCFEKVFEGRTPEEVRESWRYEKDNHIPREKSVIIANSIQ